MACVPRRPLVAVVGATGTGKSQLAVEIAREYNGEIINGDAMQLYDGLPIITNKIKEEEMKGIPHHLLGLVSLDEPTWTVDQFIKHAAAIIEEIRSRGRLPILVGGTHYYTQSLLFGDESTKPETTDDYVPDMAAKWPILNEDSSVILAKLREVDPVMADRWHPNDRRKIQRSLEIYLQTGKPASKIYDEQRLRRDQGSHPGAHEGELLQEASPTRYDPLVFWVYVPQDVLPARLDKRVDKMLTEGLLSEVQALDSILLSREAAGQKVDRTRGIWPSIGYKEFEAHQKLTRDPGATSSQLAMSLEGALERVKIATRQYAKSQLKWIRIKLVNAFRTARLDRNFYLLDGADIARFHETVEVPALEVTGKFLAGEEVPEPAGMSDVAAEMLSPKRDYDLSSRPDLWEKKMCEVCGTTAVTAAQWESHVKGRKHRSLVKKTTRLQLMPVESHDAG